jgi:hypothetical protein
MRADRRACFAGCRQLQMAQVPSWRQAPGVGGWCKQWAAKVSSAACPPTRPRFSCPRTSHKASAFGKLFGCCGHFTHWCRCASPIGQTVFVFLKPRMWPNLPCRLANPTPTGHTVTATVSVATLAGSAGNASEVVTVSPTSLSFSASDYSIEQILTVKKSKRHLPAVLFGADEPRVGCALDDH